MLVLGRYVGEEIVIGDVVRLKVLKIRNGQVQLGFDAPKEVSIHRGEIIDSEEQNRVPGKAR